MYLFGDAHFYFFRDILLFSRAKCKKINQTCIPKAQSRREDMDALDTYCFKTYLILSIQILGCSLFSEVNISAIPSIDCPRSFHQKEQSIQSLNLSVAIPSTPQKHICGRSRIYTTLHLQQSKSNETNPIAPCFPPIFVLLPTVITVPS